MSRLPWSQPGSISQLFLLQPGSVNQPFLLLRQAGQAGLSADVPQQQDAAQSRSIDALASKHPEILK